MVTSAGVRPPGILRPALAVVNRTRTGVRLRALVVGLLVPGLVATSAYTTEVNAKIAFSTLERDGTELVRPALLALAETVAGHAPDLDAVRRAADDRPPLGLDDALRALPARAGTPPA